MRRPRCARLFPPNCRVGSCQIPARGVVSLSASIQIAISKHRNSLCVQLDARPRLYVVTTRLDTLSVSLWTAHVLQCLEDVGDQDPLVAGSGMDQRSARSAARFVGGPECKGSPGACHEGTHGWCSSNAQSCAAAGAVRRWYQGPWGICARPCSVGETSPRDSSDSSTLRFASPPSHPPLLVPEFVNTLSRYLP